MRRCFLTTCGLVLLGLVATASTPAGADVISLRADEWCPYNCAPDSDKPGYMVEIAKRVFEPARHQVDYQVLNWARAIEATRSGKFTGIIGAAHSDAEDFVFPAVELGIMTSAFAVRASEDWSYAGIQSLGGRTLGVIRDYAYNPGLDQYIAAHKDDDARIQFVYGDNALESNLRKLLKGRLDTVVDGQYVLAYTLTRLGLEKEIRMAGTAAEVDPLYIAFSPANPKAAEYAALLSKGVTELRANGELQKVLAKYGLHDWR